jgi:uncharacterized alpha-E superfamily protein
MLSRIADSLYWMSRYLERVDNTARLVDINLLHLLEAEDVVPASEHWRPLLSISSSMDAYQAVHRDGAVTANRVIQFLVHERANPSSIRSSLRFARDNARVVRDRISKEMWEIMNELWLRADPILKSSEPQERMAEFCRYVRNEVARFHGVTVSTMMRGEAWGFYQLGTFVERADMTARILDVKYHLLLPGPELVGSALDYYQWAALLKSLSGFEAYRRKYNTGMRPTSVAEFVILSPDFPRALRFSIDRIAQALDGMAAEAPCPASAHAVAALQADVAHRSADTIFQHGLHEFLEDFVTHVGALDGTLHDEVFHGALRDAACAG